jgi:hypothetical protein
MGVALTFVPGKIFELLFFGVIIIVAGTIFAAFSMPSSNAYLKKKINALISVMEKNTENTITVLILFFIIPLVTLLFTQIIYLANFYLLYQLIFSSLFFYIAFHNPNLINLFTRLINKINPKYFSIGIIVLTFSIIAFSFRPYFTDKPYISSEYYNLSGETILNGTENTNTKNELEKYSAQLRSGKVDSSGSLLERIGYFESKNRFFLGWIFMNRWVIHHHNFILNPINQLECGAKPSEICALYGAMSATVFHTIMKHTTGINIQGWLLINYSSFIIYLLFAVITLTLVFRNLTIPAMFCLSYLIYFQSDFIINCILGPGSAPWRNFFDIITLLFITLYLREKKPVFLVPLFFSLAASLIMNSEMGIMISAAAISVLFFDALKTGVMKKVFPVLFLMPAAVIAIYLLLPKNSAGYAGYFIKGLLGMENADQYIIFFAIAASVIYYILYQMNRESHRLFYPALYLFIYSQTLQIYYIWHHNTTGFISRSYIYFLLISLLLLYIFGKTAKKRDYRFPAVALMLVLSFAAILSFSRLKRDLALITYTEKSHVTYVWNFDRAAIKSSMNPAPIQSAVSMIQRYVKDSGIHIISDFDNLLPFLAKKTSLMPFFDMKWFFITEKEMQLSIDKLKHDRPEFLFVDSDIEDDKEKQIIPEDATFFKGLHQESVWRVEREKLLKRLFSSVKDEYRLVEKGELISVYKRK